MTRLPGALPLQGVASLRVADAAVACTDVCGASSAVVQEPQKAGSKGWFARGLLGGDGGSGEAPGGGGVVHLEVSESVALTGNAHLLHGGSASALRSLPSFLPTKKSSSLSAASSTLWIVSPSVSVADKSTIRVAGGLSVDGGPAGSGFLSVRGGGSVRVLPAPPDAASYVFNVATVHVDSGGSLVVDGAGALTVTGRGEDAGSLTVGDEDEADSLVSEAAPATSSSIVAGRLVLDRFGAVRVRRGGAVRATSYVTDETQDDAQCSSTRCPAYVFGEEEESSGFIFSKPGKALGGEALAADDAVPCQAGAVSPFALQLCHGAVDVDGGGVSRQRRARVRRRRGAGGRGALHADAAGCRAGEGEGLRELCAAPARRGTAAPAGTGSRPTVRLGVDVLERDRARGARRTARGRAVPRRVARRAGSLGSGGGAGARRLRRRRGGLARGGRRAPPAAALIVGVGGRLSANGGDGGKAAAALTGAAGAAEGADGSDTLAGSGGGGGAAGRCSCLPGLRGGRRRARRADGRGAGGGSAAGAGRGRGGGRVHLEWARDGAGGANAPPRRGEPDRAGRDRHRRRRRRRRGTRANSERPGRAGGVADARSGGHGHRVGGRAWVRGPVRAVPSRDVQGGHGQRRVFASAASPGARFWIRPRRPDAGGATSRPSASASGGGAWCFRVRDPRRAAVAAVGGPAAAGRGARRCGALRGAAARRRRPARARGGAPRAGRGGGRRPTRFGSGFPDGSPRDAAGATARPRARASRARQPPGSGDAVPRRSRDPPRAGGSGSGSTADGARRRRRRGPRARSAGVLLRRAFGDPWRLPPRPPVRAAARGGMGETRARVRDGRARELGRGPAEARAALGSPRPEVPETRRPGRDAAGRFGGSAARPAGGRGAVDAILGALFAPGQTWRERERRRVAACLDTLLDAYDRRCLRSARARALQEGLAFGCSDDARVAWLDFFAQGDEEDAFPSFPTSSAEASAEDRGASREAKRRGEELTNVTALTEHLPLAVVFSGEGTFQAPWRWETAPETAADEGLPAAALRRAVPPATLAVAGREVRARRCGGATAWSASPRRRTLSCHRACAAAWAAAAGAAGGGASVRLRRRRRSRLRTFPGPGPAAAPRARARRAIGRVRARGRRGRARARPGDVREREAAPARGGAGARRLRAPRGRPVRRVLARFARRLGGGVVRRSGGGRRVFRASGPRGPRSERRASHRKRDELGRGRFFRR